MDKGNFIISLDYELMWGVRDKKTIEDYGDAIVKGQDALYSLVDLLKEYSCTTTIATVGFLFLEDEASLKGAIPDILPAYHDSNLTPYHFIQNELSGGKKATPYYFSHRLTEQLAKENHVEMATHTYSHYYCLEPGQTDEAFEEDIKYAVRIAKEKGVEIKSIVFPRNQLSQSHIDICAKHGITSYRGNPKHWIYRAVPGKEQHLIRRMLRLIDTYVNITGHHVVDLEEVKTSHPYNIPASRFLKPYSPYLKFLDAWKLRRIKRSMTHAAKEGKIYHLWWHPHNFGNHSEKNLAFLAKILAHYKKLSEAYGFQSITMADLSDQLKKGE
ncbi:MAG: polysaccharide deacetylase family protein [Flavobacteriaceae bacterium]|nr:polysaccharide deacetylase family protein [Flavobacteriaceae bacterium]